MKRILPYLIIFSILILSLSFGLAQFKIKIPKKIPGLDKILKRKPVLTTSISDALTEVPFLDNYNPKIAFPLSLEPRTPDGGFILEKSGHYMFEAQSFCLAPGKGSPGGDYGFLYAPLKGPYSDIIRNILRKSYKHPEIPQQDIQVLLWGIISRTKISDMPREIQLTAAKLLTPKEIFKVNGGALALIPKSVLDKALEKLPPEVRRVIEAEAKIREMLTRGYSSYEELERVAVVQEPVPPGKGSRNVPPGRWSLHPEGFFIRYFPRGYSRTLIQLYVPGTFQIERDEIGRIVSITGPSGYRIETIYDDSIEPVSISEEPSLKAYAFKMIIFEGFSFDKRGIIRKEWENIGWTFASNTEEGKGSVHSNRFPNFKQRYELYKREKEELINLNKGLMKLKNSPTNKLTQEGLEEILTIGSYVQAVKEVFDFSDDENWVTDPASFAKEAWMASVSKNLIGYKDKYIFEPAGDPAGGNTGEQSLGESGRGTDKNEKCFNQFISALLYSQDAFKDMVDDCNLDPEEEYFCDADELLNCIKKSTSERTDFGCVMDACIFEMPVPLVIPGCLQMAINAYRKWTNTALEQYSKCMKDP